MVNSSCVRARLLLSLTLLTLSIVSYSVTILADEMEEDDSAQSAVQSDSATANTDSLYGIIRQEFTKLEPIWKKACFDCHSDKTVYPWYYKLPLIKGMIDEDINDARAEIDMSNGFPFVSQRKPVDDLRKLGREVAEGGMPPGKYKIMHWSASLSQVEKDSVAAFVDNSLKLLAAHGITPTPRPQRPEGN
jgi:hypothetical protein